MGEEQIPMGLGKMFVCSIEDLNKKPKPLEELIKIEPGMLTYKDDDEKPSYSKKGFNIGFDATIDDPNEELVKLVERKNRWDVMLQQKPGRMPRKMKKAYLSNYPRNTKWKSRVKRLLSSICHHFPDAEVVITQDHFDSLASLIEVSIKSANKDAAGLCQKLDEAILSKDLSKYDGFLPLIEKETTTQCVGLED